MNATGGSDTVHTTVGPRALADTPWPDVPRGALVIIPLGTIEQHGPHLPLDVDTVIATAVAERVAPALAAEREVLVGPAVAFGASGEHQSFAGTVSAGQPALELYLVEIARSLFTWAGALVFVNGHGGNVEALVRAVQLLRREGRDAAWLSCEHGDIHAGHEETSLMLHLAPERVHMTRAVAGPRVTLQEVLPALREGGFSAVTSSGVIGDPRGASAEEGKRVLDRIVALATRVIQHNSPDAAGRLI